MLTWRLALAFGIAGAWHQARADACGTLMDAMAAQAKVPYAADGTLIQAGQAPMHTALVVTGDKMYVLVMGQWQSLPFSAEDTIRQAKQKMAASRPTCAQTGTDAVNGEATTIFTEHADKRGSAESRMWISNSRGLPLKLEIKLPAGAMTQTLQYRYDNVQAPAGAK